MKEIPPPRCDGSRDLFFLATYTLIVSLRKQEIPMEKYHPVRYPLLQTSIESASSKLNWQMRELSMLHGADSPLFKQRAKALVDQEIPKDMNFKRSQKFKNAIDSVHAFWREQGSVMFDVHSLDGADAFDWEHAHLMNFNIPAQHLYLHFGEESGFHLERQPSVFMDGVYLTTVPKGGRDGISLAFVTNETGWEEWPDRTYGEEMAAAGRMAAAWVAFEEPISKTLRERGVVGDPTLISDPTMLRVVDEMDTMIGRLCAAEHEMIFKDAGTRH